MSNIPRKIAAQVMFESDMKCCVCSDNTSGVHIHHIDENNKNHKIENLAFLCFEHHDQASIKASLRRKLSKETIVLYRKEHLEKIAIERKNKKTIIDRSLDSITEQDLINASRSAIISLELEKTQHEYFNAELDVKEQLISGLRKYLKFNTQEITHEILNFLYTASGYFNWNMNSNVSSSITQIISAFVPLYDRSLSIAQVSEFGKLIAEIGSNLAYFSIMKSSNIVIATDGLLQIKYAYRLGVSFKIEVLKENAKESFSELTNHYKRSETPHSAHAIEIIEIICEELDDDSMCYPIMPGYIYKYFENF